MTAKPKIIPAVLGLAIRTQDNKQEFLLTRRHAPHKAIMHNKWQLPGGGLEFGEKPEETLVREFNEELGVSPTLLAPRPLVRTTIWIGGDVDVEHDVQILLICYLVSIGDQVLKAQDEEANAMQWFEYNKTQELETLPNTKEFIIEASDIFKCEGLSKWS